MNGYKLLEDATRLLGFEQLDERVKIVGLQFIAAVFEEMGYAIPKSLSERLPLLGDGERMTALYGIAMHIANISGEGDMRAAFSETYNRRKATAKGRKDRVKNSIFKGEGL